MKNQILLNVLALENHIVMRLEFAIPHLLFFFFLTVFNSYFEFFMFCNIYYNKTCKQSVKFILIILKKRILMPTGVLISNLNNKLCTPKRCTVIQKSYRVFFKKCGIYATRAHSKELNNQLFKLKFWIFYSKILLD